MVNLSWSLITSQFEAQYDDVYMHKDAKVHFDFCNDVVDGAKERWRTLIFLDAIACCLSTRDPDELSRSASGRRKRSHRRLFNQHEAFRSSVFYAHGVAGGSTEDASCEEINLVDIDVPWTSFEALHENLIYGDTKKSWERRKGILDKLLASDGMYSLDLRSVLLACVNKICLSVETIPYVPEYVPQISESVKSEEKSNKRQKNNGEISDAGPISLALLACASESLKSLDEVFQFG